MDFLIALIAVFIGGLIWLITLVTALRNRKDLLFFAAHTLASALFLVCTFYIFVYTERHGFFTSTEFGGWEYCIVISAVHVTWLFFRVSNRKFKREMEQFERRIRK